MIKRIKCFPRADNIYYYVIVEFEACLMCEYGK